MKFIYSEWEDFCKALSDSGLRSVTSASVLQDAIKGNSCEKRFVTLKHDVESLPSKALDFARIEHKYGHRASYYVQSYLMNEENYSIFSQIQQLGHEVSYHHDVMDGAKGDWQAAMAIYKENLDKFSRLGFDVTTVCQHGNPVSDFANRDFFRSDLVQNLYPDQADIMVDFMRKINREYTYISDFGMSYKIVKDPIEVENLHDDDKYIVLGDVMNVAAEIISHPQESYIVSAHTHRYNRSAFKSVCRRFIFRAIRCVAKILFLIPGMKKFLFRFNVITKYL